jgi:DNA-directed RNA polymerase subunit H (RpoH/RPB5)
MVLVYRLYAIFLFLLIFQTSFSQTVIEGQLLNEESKEPIPYANIGILDSYVGTITNNDGTFEISIPEEYETDSLLFAALGFERKSIVVSSILNRKKITIYLKEQSTVLKNITVKTKKLKPIRSADEGNMLYDVGSLYVDSLAGGSAMALLIENSRSKHPDFSVPYFITHARLRISYNSLDLFRIRVRFLSVDPETGLPGDDLFNESVIVTSRMLKGWLSFDLSKYTVRIQAQSFYLVFEWILEDEERVELINQYQEYKKQFPKRVTTDTAYFKDEKVVFTKWQGYRAGTSFGSSSAPELLAHAKCYYRNNSHGKWKRSSYVLAATVTIVNYN